jgi:hypothetical protein
MKFGHSMNESGPEGDGNSTRNVKERLLGAQWLSEGTLVQNCTNEIQLE